MDLCFSNSRYYGDFRKLKIVVEFFMYIPGFKANVERISSDMNNLWTDDKNRFDVKIVLKAI